MKKRTHGFTMIELLIVIAVLGILAVAVLAAINPLEQIRRGRDTGSRSDSEQLISALDRRYAGLGYFPWQAREGEDVTPGAADVDWVRCGGIGGATACDTWLDTLSTEEEVKIGFQNRLLASTANPIMVYYNDEEPGASIYSCFIPQSKSMATDAGTECGVKRGGDDFPPLACPANCEDDLGDANECYICLP